MAGALAGGDLQLLNPKHTLGFVLFSSKTNKQNPQYNTYLLQLGFLITLILILLSPGKIFKKKQGNMDANATTLSTAGV